MARRLCHSDLVSYVQQQNQRDPGYRYRENDLYDTLTRQLFGELPACLFQGSRKLEAYAMVRNQPPLALRKGNEMIMKCQENQP